MSAFQTLPFDRPVFMNLSDEQRLDWLQLIRSDNVGPSTFRTLVNKFGGARAALEALPALMKRATGARAIRLALRADCEREMEATQRFGARLIALGEPEYPPALREIDAPPPLLCVKGHLSALKRPMVAIVGARNASAAGLAFTERLTHELSVAEYVIASGLARGVDQRAHRAALRTGTIAVLAGGLDRIYPPEHVGLSEEICDHGVLVSEMPLGWEPRGRDFPRRNRIVSGLAMGIVVVEAARKSGSLITARFANEQGREVFAVPGSPLDPRAEGTNDLLRQGATLCTSGADVIDALAPTASGLAPLRTTLFEDDSNQPAAEPLWDETDLFGDPAPPRSQEGLQLDEESAPPIIPPVAMAPPPIDARSLEDRLADLLGPAPVGLDDLVRASGASAGEVQAILLDLELQGRANRRGNLVTS
jgi:DNA processing protein